MPCDHPQASRPTVTCLNGTYLPRVTSYFYLFLFFIFFSVVTGSDLKELDGGHCTSVSAGSLDGCGLSLSA